MTWPNFISLGRLFTTPVLIWLLLSGRTVAAFYVFILAGLSDILDGILARALKDHSIIGSYLDPIADKCLLTGAFIALGVKGLIPIWLIIFVTFRDAMIVGGAILLILLGKKLRVQPLLISKLNTLLQILLVVYVMGEKVWSFNFSYMLESLTSLTALTTFISGAGYVVLWVKIMKKDSLS